MIRSPDPLPASVPASPTVHPFDAPLGAEVRGVDLSRPLDARTFGVVEAALHRHGVIVLRGQRIDDAQQKAFSHLWGAELDIHPLRQFAKPAHPEVFVLSNIKVDGEPVGAADAAQYWHTDLSYTTHPSRVSILYAVEVPQDPTGPLGDTEFASTVQAWRELPEEVRRRLEGRRAFHDALKARSRSGSHFGKPLQRDVQARLAQVSHPVVRTHPFTGEKCLYVNEGFTLAIEGMDPDESDALLASLYRHTTRPECLYAHKWAVGDVLVWDNCATVHQGVPNYGPHQPRLMYRTIVKGSVPV
jgi:taurine dioxygenase